MKFSRHGQKDTDEVLENSICIIIKASIIKVPILILLLAVVIAEHHHTYVHRPSVPFSITMIVIKRPWPIGSSKDGLFGQSHYLTNEIE